MGRCVEDAICLQTEPHSLGPEGIVPGKTRQPNGHSPACKTLAPRAHRHINTTRNQAAVCAGHAPDLHAGLGAAGQGAPDRVFARPCPPHHAELEAARRSVLGRQCPSILLIILQGVHD